MPRSCKGLLNRLVLLRTPGLAGPFFQNAGGACLASQGNFFGPGRPGSGPQALRGTVIDASTLEVVFSQCVSIPGPGWTGIEYNLDGGSWATVTSATKVSDTVWRFDITPATVDPGQDVRWRYVGGNDSIIDCEEAADIGDQEIPLNNPLVLVGDFVLLETGGIEIALVEEDPDGSEGVQVEEAL